MSFIKGKQIKDASLDLSKINTGSKILPAEAVLGNAKSIEDFANDNEFITKEYADSKIQNRVLYTERDLTAKATPSDKSLASDKALTYQPASGSAIEIEVNGVTASTKPTQTAKKIPSINGTQNIYGSHAIFKDPNSNYVYITSNDQYIMRYDEVNDIVTTFTKADGAIGGALGATSGAAMPTAFNFASMCIKNNVMYVLIQDYGIWKLDKTTGVAVTISSNPAGATYTTGENGGDPIPYNGAGSATWFGDPTFVGDEIWIRERNTGWWIYNTVTKTAKMFNAANTGAGGKYQVNGQAIPATGWVTQMGSRYDAVSNTFYGSTEKHGIWEYNLTTNTGRLWKNSTVDINGNTISGLAMGDGEGYDAWRDGDDVYVITWAQGVYHYNYATRVGRRIQTTTPVNGTALPTNNSLSGVYDYRTKKLYVGLRRATGDVWVYDTQTNTGSLLSQTLSSFTVGYELQSLEIDAKRDVIYVAGRLNQPQIVSSQPNCQFSPDGITFRAEGEAQIGDKLYWNPSSAGYTLEADDQIDITYLTNK